MNRYTPKIYILGVSRYTGIDNNVLFKASIIDIVFIECFTIYNIIYILLVITVIFKMSRTLMITPPHVNTPAPVPG